MDWDNDGKDDLIMGNVHGRLFFFRRTGSGVNDLTSEGQLCYANGDTIDVGSRSNPFICDWDNDGKLDMIVGSQAGKVRLFLNTGTTSEPAFDESVTLQDGDSNLRQNNSSPFVIDYNEDGKKDIIVASYRTSYPASVYYYENKGTDANPVFNGFVEILDQAGNPLHPGSYINIWMADWNGDNLLDFLGSSGSGKIVISYAISTAVSEETSATIVSSMEISAAVNPARNSFSVRLTDPGDSVDITAYDSSGRIVGSRVVNDRSELVAIPADELPTGVYTILASDDNNVSSCRIVLVK